MRKLARGLLWMAVVFGIIVGVARAVALRWWRIPEGDPSLEASIAPTMRPGDMVILWRLSAPSFGDLVLCPEPGSTGRVAIGRLVGEPRDVVEVEGSSLWINTKRAETETACSDRKLTVRDPVSLSEVELNCTIEAIGGISHMRGNAVGQTNTPIHTQHTVGEGKLFLVSDNRQYPWDSRRYGQPERKACTETFLFRLWSKQGFFDVKNRFNMLH